MPRVWLVEDDARQSKLVKRIVRQVAPGATVSVLGSVSAVRARCKEVSLYDAPNVAIIDMMLPLGPGQAVARYGGETAATEILGAFPNTDVVFRTAFDTQAATRLPEMVVVPKRDEQSLIDSLSAILASQGFKPLSTITRDEQAPLVLATGPVSQRLWSMGALAAAGSAWTATLLQVLSVEPPWTNVWFVALGGLGGALLGLAVTLRGVLRVCVATVAVVALLAAVLAPLALPGSP